MNPALALQQAMRAALLADTALIALLGGQHIFDEVPRGEQPLHVVFANIETRDWSVMDQKAHQHFVTIEVSTNDRSRVKAQSIAQRVETVLHDAALTLTGHRLINLRNMFLSVSRGRTEKKYGAQLRFRASTEPL
jgi:hypothetical protein